MAAAAEPQPRLCGIVVATQLREKRSRTLISRMRVFAVVPVLAELRALPSTSDGCVP